MIQHYRKLLFVFFFISIALITTMLYDPLLIKSLLRMNHFNSDDGNGNITSTLIYTFNGYEMIICGNGEMSEYMPKEWTKKLLNTSSGWKVSIKTVNIREGIVSISIGAFVGCNELNGVYLPHSIKRIGMKTFAYCSSLDNVVYQGTLEEWNCVMYNSPLWNSESFITSVICTDGIYYVS